MTKPPTPSAPVGQRIAKLLARAGIASRREIERMIDEGRVALDGNVLSTAATIIPSLRGVTVDGQPVRAAEAARLFRYHKPAGLLTAERDPLGRRTIYDALPKDLPRVMPVGRLDLATEGLLLLTTDGELKRQLELPATGVERVYRARTFGAVSQGQLEELIQGVTIEGVRYGSIDANLERRTGRNQWIEMRLREGKNREVRRVLEHLGLQVSRLIRTAYGPFKMDDLAPGGVLEVRARDLEYFRKNLGGHTSPFAAPAEEDDRPPERLSVAPRAQRSVEPRAVAAPRAPVPPPPPTAPAATADRPKVRRERESVRSRNEGANAPRPRRASDPGKPGAASTERPPRARQPSAEGERANPKGRRPRGADAPAGKRARSADVGRPNELSTRRPRSSGGDKPRGPAGGRGGPSSPKPPRGKSKKD